MKYRPLTKKELEPFKNEFIQFLSSHTITGDDWEKMKTEKPMEAQRMIDIFSDIVWEKSLEKITFLEHRDHKHLNVFKCNKESLNVIGFALTNSNAPSLLKEKTFKDIASGKILFSDLKAEFHQSQKNYKKNRQADMFELMEKGCTPCTEAYYYGIKSLLK